MIKDPDAYFAHGCGRCPRFDTSDCATRHWSDGLADLRAICLGAGLTETAKWGHPCYMHADRNIAIIGALRTDFRLSFFNAALMTDPLGILEKQGPNTHHADMIRFGADRSVGEVADTVRAYLREAMDYAERGLRPPQVVMEVDLPDDLVSALDDDPALAEAFAALTPGRQRSYVIHLSSSKQTATRLRRILGYRDRILAGKGANER